jgi:hypothetical protein
MHRLTYIYIIMTLIGLYGLTERDTNSQDVAWVDQVEVK